MFPRKRLSGAQYRKRAESKVKKAKQSAAAMCTWLEKNKQSSSELNKSFEEELSDSDESENMEREHLILRPELPSAGDIGELNKNEASTSEKLENYHEDVTKTEIRTNCLTRENEAVAVANDMTTDEIISVDPSEPGTWPTCGNMSDQMRCYLSSESVKLTKTFPESIDFKLTERDNRHLTPAVWYKDLSNDEKVKRTWLIYSNKENSLFCVPCKLFKSYESLKPGMYSLQTTGFKNWKKMLEKLRQHENSKIHVENLIKWKTLLITLGSDRGVCSRLEKMIEYEKNKWREILHIIIDAILYLATNCLPLRGSKETQSELHISYASKEQGNFLNLIILLSKHNATLKTAVEELKKGHVSYLSKTIQNEIIEMMGNRVRQKILNDVYQAKYYTIMFDCTPDVSHTEQMSQVIRYVTNNETGNYVIKESFIDFLTVSGKTGDYLTRTILCKLEKDGLNIKDCRGQSYDNGSNMAGVYKGVQARLLEINPKATYIPCIAHSLNLVGVHAASISPEASNVFGVVQRLYTYFVSSTQRWEIMKKYSKKNLQGTSQTRWSAKSEAVHALKQNFGKIIEALKELKEGQYQPETKSEADSLLHALLNFRFIAYLVAWEELLKEINRVNKEIQKDDIILSKSLEMLSGLTTTLERLRNSPNNWLKIARQLSESLGIEPTMETHRIPKKKIMPGEKMLDEARLFSAEERYCHSVKEIVDVILSQIKTRMESTKLINEYFSFLYGEELAKLDNDTLEKRAILLSKNYAEDLSVEEFPSEILVFRDQIKDIVENLQKMNALDLLNLIHSRDLLDAFPNVCIALRMYATLPTTSAGCERSFSKLKLIKTYLRSNMTQERLTNLAILSIESEESNSVNYDDAINEFAEKKARKVIL